MRDELDKPTRVAIMTCPKGANAIDQAVADTHHWKGCLGQCWIEVCVEEELSPPVIKVIGEPSCLPKEDLIYPTSAKIAAIDKADAIDMMKETISTNLVGS